MQCTSALPLSRGSRAQRIPDALHSCTTRVHLERSDDCLDSPRLTNLRLVPPIAVAKSTQGRASLSCTLALPG